MHRKVTKVKVHHKNLTNCNPAHGKNSLQNSRGKNTLRKKFSKKCNNFGKVRITNGLDSEVVNVFIVCIAISCGKFRLFFDKVIKTDQSLPVQRKNDIS